MLEYDQGQFEDASDPGLQRQSGPRVEPSLTSASPAHPLLTADTDGSTSPGILLPNSLSANARGSRALPPAPLDLSAGYAGDSLPQQQTRRVSRPLPVPPRSKGRSELPASTSVPLSAAGSEIPELQDIYTQSRARNDLTHTISSHSPLDPSAIDRQGLVGVGELSTPRWASSSRLHDQNQPPLPERASSSVAHAKSPSTQGKIGEPKKQPLLSLNIVDDFDFDTTMAAALAASPSLSPERASLPKFNSAAHIEPQQMAPEAFTMSPNTARARIYARRQSRQAQTYPHTVFDPVAPVIVPTDQGSDAKRESRKTPPNAGPRSKIASSASHDILKQFTPKNFSHLPPSPSSASINQFLRASGSVGSFAAGNSSGSYPTSASMGSLALPANPMKPMSVDPDVSEALRRLDGLGATPGKKTPKAKGPAGVRPTPSRPGTPLGGNRSGMIDEQHDPLSEPTVDVWVDAEEAFSSMAVNPQQQSMDHSKTERSPSTSAVATPTSGGSFSRPTSSTTPSSGGKDKTGRRASGGSIASAISDLGVRDIEVPPVPPIPKNVGSNRQTSSHVTPDLHPPPSIDPRPRQMSKKWSFSSALSLRLAKDTTPMSPLPLDEGGPESVTVATGSKSLTRDGKTPEGMPPGNSKTAPAKRPAPSSIPFFRRASSSSTTTKSSEAPTSSNPANAGVSANGSIRKSVLGMTFPSMLRGNSRRFMSDESSASETFSVKKHAIDVGHGGSAAWSGSKMGKTMSNSGDITPNSGASSSVATIVKTRPPAMTSDNRSSSDQSESTVHVKPAPSANRGSPTTRHPLSPSAVTDSHTISATPTRIPRLRPADSPRGYMQSTYSRSNTTSSRKMSNSISEFGSIHATSKGQISSGSHRAHLLAPMSVRAEVRRSDRGTDQAGRQVVAQLIPPSRRHMPMASIAAPTASSIAKRTSREFRPNTNNAASSGSQTPRESSSPIKPSKSMHAKLSVPVTSRLPSSSSLGATSRDLSLVSPTISPADDDETQADLEMAAYIKRRQARHASGKKEDLSDIEDFPEDIPPASPISQREFIAKRLAMLSDQERQEVLDFEQIYYAPDSRLPRPSNGTTYNHGYDDERGDYIVVAGDHLCYRYQVMGLLGKGSFGQVVQCRDHKTGGSVAVKIIRNKKRFHTQALVEVKILQQLVEWDPEDRHHVVRMTDHFYFRGHLCIVTEMLSINLYELIKANQFSGFSTVLIRRFTSQMLGSLQLMRSHRIVHCDLKPENILLRHPWKSGIKVIDFGSSCLETEKVYTYIQSRFYRSPEVILGMNYAMAIDMWSLGCILAELFTGVPIFPGENEHEQLACIMEVLGAPEKYLVDRSSRKKLFFDATGAPRPFVSAKGKRRRPGSKTLAMVLKCEDELFVDFIAKCLTWDPDKRIKPQAAMRHPWLLAGRRRQAPSVPVSAGRIPQSATKSGLIISPPTPLTARAAHLTSGSGASRYGGLPYGHNGGHSSQPSQTRNTTTGSGQKVRAI